MGNFIYSSFKLVNFPIDSGIVPSVKSSPHNFLFIFNFHL